ncbi:hypothetical protein [Leptolyngbya sp. PCC 6406]|uniref:hypothetical protein n=1 Tax=Leptolyngbya sp. PCC 6406 TaxID=1173264 RepID=UPI000481BD51|nr:hypothetical protein [Leptolyngbya sp. PCC 6406]
MGRVSVDCREGVWPLRTGANPVNSARSEARTGLAPGSGCKDRDELDRDELDRDELDRDELDRDELDRDELD